MNKYNRTILCSIYMLCITAMAIAGVELTETMLFWLSAPVGLYVGIKGKGNSAL